MEEFTPTQDFKYTGMSPQTAALFDLDGVIIDTEPQYTQFWKAIGKQNHPDVADFPARVKGQTLSYILDHYFPDAETRERISEQLTDYESTMKYPFISGALKFVDALRAAGIETAVVTSSNQLKMQQLFKHHPDFTSHFTQILTAEDTTKSKPAPDCYLNAARVLHKDIRRCVVFEDSYNGLRAGRAAGALVVGLSTTLSPTDIAPLADEVIPDFAAFTTDDLQALILRHSSDIQH